MARRMTYKTQDGKRVPGVTTILSRFKDSGGLLYWSNTMGLEGKTIEEARQKVTTPGSMVHDMIEEHVNGRPPPNFEGMPAEAIRMAGNSFKQYLKWQKQTMMEVEHTEIALVSERLEFGGRIDAIGKDVDGELAVIDWKSGSTYGEHLLQVAAYKLLWEENYPDHPIRGGVHLCSFKKETADFSHSYFGNVDHEERAFALMRDLYDRVKTIEKRVR